MNSFEAWNIFLKTGAVEDYINYSRCRKREADGGGQYENQNNRSGIKDNRHKG